MDISDVTNYGQLEMLFRSLSIIRKEFLCNKRYLMLDHGQAQSIKGKDKICFVVIISDLSLEVFRLTEP